MEITKRELLVSISIVALMLIFGFLISDKLTDYFIDQDSKYRTADSIENNPSLFSYAIDTNIGNCFVYGTLEAVDPVTYEELDDTYMYVEKVKQKYTRHTRQVAHTTTVNGRTHTYYTTQVYYSWDTVDREHKSVEKVTFCGVEFDIGKIDIPGDSYIKTIKESSDVRYEYYAVDKKYVGTIFTSIDDHTISNNSQFYVDEKIEPLKEKLTDHSVEKFGFWFVWILLTVLICFGFFYFENKWLE